MNKILKCKKCGKEIQGGHYNTPNGAYCCECWEKTPQQSKDKVLADALKKLAVMGYICTNL